MDITHESYFIRRAIVDKNLTDLRHLSPEQVQTIVNLLKEYQRQREELVSINKKHSRGLDCGTRKLINGPLLTIELQDETSVPKVFYKGKELIGKSDVWFEWKTQREHKYTGGVDFKVNYYDKEIESVRTIGRKSGKFIWLNRV